MSDTEIKTLDALKAIYGDPSEASLVKEVQEVIPEYRAFIEASPFCTLATTGPDGLDCSPRGDKPGFVRVYDNRTLMMPDRRGNNRVDSLANIVLNPKIALCFLVPGSRTCLRVNGTATLSVDPDLLNSFEITGKAPRSVIVINTEAVYFQCGRAIERAGLWSPDAQIEPKSLPTPGEMLAAVSNHQIGGEDYDRDWESRAKETLW